MKADIPGGSVASGRDGRYRPIVAFLRPGATLAEYEMNYVSLLADDFALRVLTVGDTAIGGTPEGVRRLKWPDEFTWKGRRRSLLNGLYARFFGRRGHVPGLMGALRGASLVQAGEAASEYSYQAARLKERLGFRLLLSASENQEILAHRDKAHEERIRFTLARVDHALAIPPAARDRLVEAGLPPEKITVIGHGIDCDRFSPERRETSDTIRVGYCGRFRREKGLAFLIEATEPLDLDLVLLGDGPDRSDLIHRAHHRVQFQPELPYGRMHNFYKGIDIFALPSIPLPGLVEQFGFVLMEAMASGIPIVASHIGGIPHVVGAEAGEGCALLVPPGDTHALREAIHRLAADPSLRAGMGAAGIARARKLFRREDVADRMRRVYRELLTA
ncbi:MAG: glycosyltransferase family 4 protein [Candidatus Hydrogenedentota bacterium]